MFIKKIALIAISTFLLTSVRLISKDLLLQSAQIELQRTMKELANKPNPPYYISYNITDSKSFSVNASYGDLRSSNESQNRILDIDLRVGDYQFDNTHIIRGNPFNFSGGAGMTSLPLDNDETAIRNAIWLATDMQYKNAIERYEKALTNQRVKVDEEDKSADMSKEKPEKFLGDRRKFDVNLKLWEERAKRISAKFSEYPQIYYSGVSFQAENLTKIFVNSEGSELIWDESFSRIMVIASTKADDGMTLPLYRSYFSFDPATLPDENSIMADVDEMIRLLLDLRNAETMTTFTGPAILSGEAAGVFFHEIFGHRVEGHREKDPNSSQTFKQSVGESILPDFIDVIFDPTSKELKGNEISGYYQFDDEGVKAQKVISVEKGKFQNFLMSRSPIENFPLSNGHGRKQAGYKAVSRQSNLIVKARETVPYEKLKEMLREECKKQEKEYGLFFVEVQGGFTFTGRTVPNAFNVQPLVVYKVFADGRPDKLVRGVDLIGTPLATFKNIIASADDLGVFNGICGAESGGVPVSACSPTLLVSSIEVQKKKKSQAKPPILDSPLMLRP